MPSCTLWQTLRLILKTERTDALALFLGLWSVLWGLFQMCDVHGRVFALSPAAYAWTQPVPEWAWGIVWAAKGAAQIAGTLGYRRACLRWDADMREWLTRNFWAAFVNAVVAFLMVWGFGRSLGLWNPWSAWYALQCAAALWCLSRISSERKGR